MTIGSVWSDASEEYSLVVTRDATFDRELNNSIGSAQAPGESSEALGFVSDLTGPSLDLIRNFSGPEFTGFVPPDPTLAAGPEHLVAMVNTTVSIFDKATGAELFTQSLSDDDGFFWRRGCHGAYL